MNLNISSTLIQLGYDPDRLILFLNDAFTQERDFFDTKKKYLSSDEYYDNEMRLMAVQKLIVAMHIERLQAENLLDKKQGRRLGMKANITATLLEHGHNPERLILFFQETESQGRDFFDIKKEYLSAKELYENEMRLMAVEALIVTMQIERFE